jgi:long-chain acyl-CoA synthetase
MPTSSSDTVSDFFRKSVAAGPHEPALGFIRRGELHWLTWQDLAVRASTLAEEVRLAGITPGDRIAQVSENRYEWIITDLALHLAGAVHVPVHITLSGPQIAHQIIDSGARLAFVSTNDVITKFAHHLPRNLPIRVHDDYARQPPAPPGVERPKPIAHAKPPAEPGAVSLANTQSLSPTPSAQRPAPVALATLLYTSGTTGRPRGVMLSHANLASNAAAVCEAQQVRSDHTSLCILPLSHIYARTCDLYTWIVSASKLVIGENRETLLRDCQLVHPTALNAVPFVYQRIMDGIVNSATDDKPAALRAAFGGRMERLFCGGAPVAPNVESWYAEHGLPLLPGYGLTEASPVIAVTTLWSQRHGTVGQAIPGVEIRTAPDGELLTGGPHVMLGYWQDEPATAEAIDPDGWLRTGDLGEIDSDGFVTILGRKKELIVLSTGKKVVPTHVESLLTASPLIDQAAVFGDGQPGLTALIVPSQLASRPACDLARPQSGTDHHALYAAEIKRCLIHAAHEEQIHHFHILDRAFSIERGELTAKMSLCRETIAQNFAAELDPARRHSPI